MEAFELTSEQRTILQVMQEQPRLVIFGCAASGKTTLAQWTARRFQALGKKVLVLCYSPVLANTYRRAFQGREIYVSDFSAFVRLLVRHRGTPGMVLPRMRWVNSKSWTSVEHPGEASLSLVIDYLFRLTTRFDAVIVDEGECFLPGWWTVVESCLTDRENGPLYIFADDNLMVYEFLPEFHYPIYEAPQHMVCNLRSGRRICELVQSLHPAGDKIGQVSRDPGVVKEFNYSTEGQIYPLLAAALASAETVLPDMGQMAVITAESVPADQGRFNGMIFDTPLLQKNRLPGRLKWQHGVSAYLAPLGFMAEELSTERVPSGEDLRRVSRFCAEYRHRHRDGLSKQPKYLGKYKLEWKLDHYGEPGLRYEPALSVRPGERDIVDFFSSGWERLLPGAHRRYRLSIPEDHRQHSDYANIRLVDSNYFKGLEAEGVIFVLRDFFAPYDFVLQRELYQAFSRPRQLLYILSPYPIRRKIAELMQST